MRSLITVGLGFGDEGKGTTIDALARHHNSKLVVRYNGASQCGHNVVTEDGVHHTFSQFGSAMLLKERILSLLGPAMMVDPLTMVVENDVLKTKGITDALARSYVHEDCLLITPFHIALNQLKEANRGESRHGSCGKGVGETKAYSLKADALAPRALHIRNKAMLTKVLETCREEMTRQAVELNCLEHPEILNRLQWPIAELVEHFTNWAAQVNIIDYERTQRLIIGQDEPVLFEGAQGVLLDEDHGFAPYNTWSNTTAEEAEGLLEVIGYQGEVEIVGIMRSLQTRHGPGPMPSEDLGLTNRLTDPRNPFNTFQREFRFGWLDIPLLRYSLAILGGIDSLVVTHTDYLIADPLVVTRHILEGQTYNLSFDYFRTGADTFERTSDLSIVDVEKHEFKEKDILPLLRAITGAELLMTSSGPAFKDKVFLV